MFDYEPSTEEAATVADHLHSECPLTAFNDVDEARGREMMDVLLQYLKGYPPSDEEVENRAADIWLYVSVITEQAREAFIEGDMDFDGFIRSMKEELTWSAYITNALDAE
jgi:hypothetical protein